MALTDDPTLDDKILYYGCGKLAYSYLCYDHLTITRSDEFTPGFEEATCSWTMAEKVEDDWIKNGMTETALVQYPYISSVIVLPGDGTLDPPVTPDPPVVIYSDKECSGKAFELPGDI